MIKKIIGGAISLVIGGTIFTISQTDVVKNFSNNSGLSQEEAQQYVNNIKESDLQSFSKIGQDFINDGNEVQTSLLKIDCVNKTYEWETSTLSCTEGKSQIQKIGNDEIALGNCYIALDTNLGDAAKSKIGECISDIDTVDADFDLGIMNLLLDTKTITENKNTNIYNKSVLQAALNSN